VCDAWERVAPLVGPFESVLSLLWTELLRCMYADFSPDMIGAGAKAYAARMPYFGEVKRLREAEASIVEKMARWEEQREQELELLAERSKAINHTLGAWNRALGYSEGAKHKDSLSEQLNSLASNLNDANSEAETLSRSAFTDPLTKCCEFFDTLVDTDQKEFLRDQMLCEAAAGCLEHDSADDITATLHNLLWGLSPEKSAAALGGLVSEMPFECRLSALEAALNSHEKAASAALGRQLGGCFTSYSSTRRKQMFESMAASLDATTKEALIAALTGS